MWSVLIVNFNVAPLLAGCLDSLRAADGGGAAQILVVDNASAEEDRAAARAACEARGARFLQNGTNAGFAAANNRAWAEAEGERLLLLNPDTLVPPDLFARFDPLLDDPRVGAVGPRFVLDEAGTAFFPPNVGTLSVEAHLHRAGRRLAALGRWRRDAWIRRCLADWNADAPRPEALLCGACMGMRRDAIEAAGGLLDEGFFLYCEDEDLCLRLRERGYRLLVEPRARVVHFHGQSAAGRMAGEHLHPSVLRLRRKHAPCRGAAGEALVRLLGRDLVPLDPQPPRERGRLRRPPHLRWEARGPGWLLVGYDDTLLPCMGLRATDGEAALSAPLWETMAPGAYHAFAADAAGRLLGPAWRWEKIAPAAADAAGGRSARRREPPVSPAEPENAWRIGPMEGTREEEESFRALFRVAFGHEMDLETWRWKYRNNPSGTQVFLARDPAAGGRIVANYSSVPVPARIGAERFLVCQITDSMSDPAYRDVVAGRKGIFVRTALRFFDRFGGTDADRFMYGFPAPRHRRLGEMLLGYVAGAPVEPLTRATPPPPPGRLSRLRRSAYRIEARTDPAPDHDAAWAAARREVAFATERDAATLRWRLSACPSHAYRLLYLRRGGRIAGWGAWEVVEGTGRMLDFWPSRDDPYAARLLPTALEEAMAAAGAERYEAWFPLWSRQAALLRERGFASAPHPDDLVLVGRVFHPGLSIDWALDNFFYSMSDVDLF